MQEIEPKLKKIFQDILWQEKEVPEKISRRSSEHWDSLAHINLLVSIEQEFSVSFSDNETMDVNSYESALAMLNEKLTSSNNSK
jgi:acyl carrier protein